MNLIRNKKKLTKFHPADFFLEQLIKFCALISCAFFIFFFTFIIINGMAKLNLKNFLFSDSGFFKTLIPIIINTLYVEFFSLLIAVPIGVGSAIFSTQFLKKTKFLKFMKFLIDILAGIPSIILGLFGYFIFCVMFSLNSSILAGSLTMAICVLPILVRTSEEAIRAVPKSFETAALSLGIPKHRFISNILLPSAAPGILTAIILASGRIFGESAALLMTVGTSTCWPTNFFKHIFSSGRTLTLHLYYLAGNSSQANSKNLCFLIAIIQLMIILLLNVFSKKIIRKCSKNFQ